MCSNSAAKLLLRDSDAVLERLDREAGDAELGRDIVLWLALRPIRELSSDST